MHQGLLDRRGTGHDAEHIERGAVDAQLFKSFRRQLAGVRVLIAADPVELVEVLFFHLLRNRLVGEEHQFVFCPFAVDDTVAEDRRFDQRDVDLFVFELIDDVGRECDTDVDLVVDLVLDIAQVVRQDVVPDGIGGAHNEGKLFVDDLQQLFFTGADRFVELVGDAVEIFTFLGQLDAVFLAFYNSRVEVILDKLDLLSDGRLGNSEFRRRFGKALFLHHSQKCLQFRKIFQHNNSYKIIEWHDYNRKLYGLQ